MTDFNVKTFSHYLCVSLFPTYATIITTITTPFVIRLPQLLAILLTNFFASTNTCWLDLYSGDLQTMTVLYTHNESSHKTDRITTVRRLLF